MTTRKLFPLPAPFAHLSDAALFHGAKAIDKPAYSHPLRGDYMIGQLSFLIGLDASALRTKAERSGYWQEFYDNESAANALVFLTRREAGKARKR